MQTSARIACFVTTARSVATVVLISLALQQLNPLSAQEPIERLVRQLHQPIASGRVEAAKQLARYGTEAAQATQPLIECLQDSESDLRLVAAFALGCVQTDSPRVLTALVPLLDDADEHVRYSAEWSVARIAKGLDASLETLDAPTRSDLLAILQSAAKELSAHEHQPRHLVAVETVVKKLTQQAARDKQAAAAPATNPPVVSESAQAPLPNVELAKSVYVASDLIARYQIAEQLCDQDAFPDSMRTLLIDVESQEVDPRILRFAMERWGARGQSLLARLIDQMSFQKEISPAESAIIDLYQPVAKEQCDRLIQLAANTSQSYEARAAALHALSRTRNLHRQCAERWLGIIADSNDDSAIRAEAAYSLGELRAVAAKAEAGLIDVLTKTSEEWMRSPIAIALGKIAPTSPAAADAVVEALRAAPTDDVAYAELIEACGAFGSLASASIPQMIAGLKNSDEFVRSSCAQALAKMGQQALPASDALVACIVDPNEVVSVKNHAAAALSETGSKGLAKLASRLRQPSDPVVLEHTLRALAIAGPAASIALSDCIALLDNDRVAVPVRSAAAVALGAMGRSASQATPSLLKLFAPEQPVPLRAASLIAAARIDPQAARPHLEECASDPEQLVRASAAFALHLCGDSRAGFDNLMQLLDGSETDAVIELALRDFGAVVEPWLTEVAADTNASHAQRSVCFQVACSAQSPDWKSLLPLIGDFELGEQFAMSIEADWYEKADTLASVLPLLKGENLNPVTRARIASLLVPDGLGAAGDDEDWQGFALNQPLAIEELTAARQAEEMVTTSPPPGVPATSQPADDGLPASSMPFPGSTASEALGSGGAPIQPQKAIRASAAQVLSTPTAPQVIDVYYGTNRARLSSDKSNQELTVSILATAGGSLLAMVFCLIGFMRSGHRAFALVALVAIGVIAPFGYLAAMKVSKTGLQAPVSYGGDYRATVELGVCEVSIPPDHKPGMLESPNIFKLEVNEDVNKHVVLTNVSHLSKDEFYQGLHSTLAKKGKNVLVFIHGYNVSFDDAARRTAQMAVDLKFPGAPVFYSWPSQANWYGYAIDKENIKQSVAQIKEFLLDIAKKSGADTINLVAHSMGNVGLTQALKEMESVSPQPMFNQVVLAAPDIDADVFKTGVAPFIVTKAKHVTLYTSKTDLALMASRYFNQGARLGDSGSGAMLYPGIDTIDATAVDSSLLGHSYYGSNVTVLTDLERVLGNQPIASRQYLRAMIDAAQPYWAFDPLRISQISAEQSTR